MAATFSPSPAPAYKVSKAALNMLTVQYALSLKNEGFTAVVISPGVSEVQNRRTGDMPPLSHETPQTLITHLGWRSG